MPTLGQQSFSPVSCTYPGLPALGRTDSIRFFCHHTSCRHLKLPNAYAVALVKALTLAKRQIVIGNMYPEFIDKEKFEKKIRTYNLFSGHSVHPEYLQFYPEQFASPKEIATRAVVLYALAYCAHEPKKRKKVSEWFKEEGLWSHINENEKIFINKRFLTRTNRSAIFRHVEAAYILAWSLGIISKIQPPTTPIQGKEFKKLVSALPIIGEPVNKFLNCQKLRTKAEIFEENLFNECATSYFRDMALSGKKYESELDVNVSFERHFALNWVRRMSGIKEWDETDTST